MPKADALKDQSSNTTHNTSSLVERILDIVLTYSIVIVYIVAAYPLLNQQLLRQIV